MTCRSLIETATLGLLVAAMPSAAQNVAPAAPAPPVAAVAPVGAVQTTPAPAPAPAPAPTPRPARPPRTGGTVAPEAPEAPQPPQPAAAPEARRPPRRGQAVNVRVEFTVSDTTGGKPPVTKMLALTVADGETAMVRSESEAQNPGGGMRSAPFSADASATVEGERVRLFFSLDYQAMDSGSGTPLKSGVRARQTVLLESGRALVLSETSDPLSDRLVRVEVKATILR
jgi:hypothetical protein